MLQAIGEELELIEYENWNVFLPEVPGGLLTKVGASEFGDVLRAVKRPEELPGALRDWAALQELMRPLARAATAVPPVAFRADAAAALAVAR